MQATRAAFTAALLVQFWALYVPRAPDPGFAVPVDKGVHFAMFAMVTWLGIRSGVPRAVMVWFMFLQAATSELTQLFFLPGRGGDWGDFSADVTGIALALLAIHFEPTIRSGARKVSDWASSLWAGTHELVLGLHRPRTVDLRAKPIAATAHREPVRR